MRKTYLLTLILLGTMLLQAQVTDTLAFQDFEVTPSAPVWTFTGPVVYNSGVSLPTAAPPSSPIGIGGSRAWESTTVSGGLVLTFSNVAIPSGYDSLRFHFNCAAFNLAGSTGGPDDLDYVLVEVSTDGGTTWYNRLRVRGAVNNNSFWGYDGLGVGKVYYTPTTEQVFQPILTGLATTLGYANLEIVFPGTVTQVAIRMTGRSSSSTDTWMVDNVVLTGEKNCTPSSSSITASACDVYIAPSGATFTTSGTVTDVITNTSGCDSIITIALTILNSTSAIQTETSCGAYTWPINGSTYSASGMFADTISNAAGCDSIITLNLTVIDLDTTVSLVSGTLTAMPGYTYQWLDCNSGYAFVPGANSQNFTPSVSGNYAVQVTSGACVDTSGCHNVTVVGMQNELLSNITLYPNPTHDRVTVSGLTGTCTLSLVNTLGQQVLEARTQGAEHTLDVSSLPAGVYTLRMTSELGSGVRKLVVE